MIRICFVCLGNICRSPTAEAVMRHVVLQAGFAGHLEIDSAGTGGWHVGETADKRSRAAANKRGISLDSRARQFITNDFERFDYVIAMDKDNRDTLLALSPQAAHKIHLLRAFDATAPTDAEIPDPYYGGTQGFDDVLDMCERACKGLLEHIVATHSLTQI